jgi:hypothetical protein
MEKVDYIAKLPNNTQSKLLIELLRSALNEDLQIVLRGSRPNKAKAKRNKVSTSQSVPLSVAEEVRVYIQPKDPNMKYMTNLGMSSMLMVAGAKSREVQLNNELRTHVNTLQRKLARIRTITQEVVA